MNRTELIVTATKLGLTIDSSHTKSDLLEMIADKLSESEETHQELLEFLDANGFALDADGSVVKKARRATLGSNPGTKAYATIKVLQDEDLAHLTYKELVDYIRETNAITTTAASIAWYASWLKGKGQPVVARTSLKKPAPAEDMFPEAEETTDVPAGSSL